jgi:hypothetical protein
MPEMVDLLRDFEQVTRVIRAFEEGGRIMSIFVSTTGSSPIPAISGLVSTADIDYPPQMVTAIKTALVERQANIAAELAGMGVTVPT